MMPEDRLRGRYAEREIRQAWRSTNKHRAQNELAHHALLASGGERSGFVETQGLQEQRDQEGARTVSRGTTESRAYWPSAIGVLQSPPEKLALSYLYSGTTQA